MTASRGAATLRTWRRRRVGVVALAAIVTALGLAAPALAEDPVVQITEPAAPAASAATEPAPTAVATAPATDAAAAQATTLTVAESPTTLAVTPSQDAATTTDAAAAPVETQADPPAQVAEPVVAADAPVVAGAFAVVEAAAPPQPAPQGAQAPTPPAAQAPALPEQVAQPPVVAVLPALPEAEPAAALSEDTPLVTVSDWVPGDGTVVTFASPSSSADALENPRGILLERNGQASSMRSIVLLPVRGAVELAGLPAAGGSTLALAHGNLLVQDGTAGPVAAANQPRPAAREDKADAARTAAARPDADPVPRPAPPQDDVPSVLTSGGWSAGPGNGGGGMTLVAAMMAALALAAPRLGRRLRLELPSLHRLLVATSLERPG